MKIVKLVMAVAVSVAAGTFYTLEAVAQTNPPVAAKNVVLVHGAWADGSSWGEVIPRLQAAGLHVTAVQNPLSSLEDSDAATRRVLALQDGPTVLVAHSWGGTVINDVGNDPKVSSLVYVAARAPDAGEDFVALSGKFPTGPVRAGIQTNDGYTRLSEDSFLKYFANGVLVHNCTFTIDFDPKAQGWSPDRVDALVWGFTDLFDGMTRARPKPRPAQPMPRGTSWMAS